MRLVLPVLASLLLGTVGALAGASSGAFNDPPPNPETKNMNRYAAKLYVFDKCQQLQSRLMGMTKEEVHSPCSCYSQRTVDQMNKVEFAFFKEKSYFDDTTRAKALNNIDACKLKRPM